MALERSPEELEDAQVMEKLDTAYLANLLDHDEKWAIIRIALKKRKEEAQAEFKRVDPMKNPLAVARIQWTLEWCDHFIERIFVGARADGELALSEAQDRELIESPKEANTDL